MAGSTSPGSEPFCFQSTSAANPSLHPRGCCCRLPLAEARQQFSTASPAGSRQAQHVPQRQRRRSQVRGGSRQAPTHSHVWKCLLWLPDLQGAGGGSWGRKGAAWGQPSSLCSLFWAKKKKHRSILTWRAVWVHAPSRPAWQPPASMPGSCEEVDTHLDQVDCISVSLCHPEQECCTPPCRQPGTPSSSAPLPPGCRRVQRKAAALTFCPLAGCKSHTLGAGSCAEAGGRTAEEGGVSLGVSHNAPLQTA